MFTDKEQAERCARGVQGWRQAFRDCAAVWDFTVRCQKGARHRGAGPKIAALISQINQQTRFQSFALEPSASSPRLANKTNRPRESKHTGYQATELRLYTVESHEQ